MNNKVPLWLWVLIAFLWFPMAFLSGWALADIYLTHFNGRGNNMIEVSLWIWYPMCFLSGWAMMDIMKKFFDGVNTSMREQPTKKPTKKKPVKPTVTLCKYCGLFRLWGGTLGLVTTYEYHQCRYWPLSGEEGCDGDTASSPVIKLVGPCIEHI